jgi:hypothetical protein
MTKQELKELLGDEYPLSEGLEARLFKRVSIFPGAIRVYARNPESICYRSSERFLVDQLRPDLVINPFVKLSASKHMENIIHSHMIHNIDWISVYEFVDTCLVEGYMKDLLNKNRERLLQLQYDII